MKFVRKLLWGLVIVSAICTSRSIASPVLVSTTPANGETNVQSTSAITFTFDVEIFYSDVMFSSFPGFSPAIKWSPGANFKYAISADQKTVTCTPTTPLPPNTTFTWTLSPADATMGFMDYDGDLLPPTSGTFTTRPSGTQNDSGATTCTISKTLGYSQTNATTTIPYADMAFFYSAAVQWTVNPVSSATLTIPGDSQTHTLSGFAQQNQLYDFDAYNSQTEMDAAIPAGTYTFNLTLQNGPATVSMNLPQFTNYPPVPKINNFDSAQSIDPSNTFTFQWTPMANVQPADSVHFYINDTNSGELFAAPDSTTALTNIAGSITIPAGLLKPGQSYEGILCFSRIPYVATNSTDKIVGIAALTRTTYFPIKTIGGQLPIAPQFSQYSLDSSGLFTLSITGQPGSQIIIEAASQLGAWQTILFTVIPENGTVVFQDGSAIGQSARFYRARSQ